ncbi:MAG TPA: hypothetical protein VFT98_04825 [Myxococcota bacterium]|nr:hypothetical protein [Myxococcota bacterium]
MHVHITTEAPGALRAKFLIARLARHWEKSRVRVTHGPQPAPGAQLGIVHVNRTRIGAHELPPNETGRPLLNERVRDISKARFSTLRVGPDDAWRGPVIVKSNLNHFGIPEARGGGRWGERARRAIARVSWRAARRLPPRRYPILPRLGEVPDWVWRDDELVVERFVPERADGLYCLRGWVFFGSRGYVYRLFSDDPLVKTGTSVRHEFLPAPPPELEAIRAAHGFDFGKFDYVEHDGRAVLLDANKTPAIEAAADSPRMRELAGALADFLPSSGARA